MNKVNVEVFIPALSKNYDMFLPPEMKIGIASRLIAKTISDHEQVEIKDDNLLLCSKDIKTVLDNGLTVMSAKIQDGSYLILL